MISLVVSKDATIRQTSYSALISACERAEKLQAAKGYFPHDDLRR